LELAWEHAALANWRQNPEIYREGLRTTTYYVTQDNWGCNWY